MRKIIGLISLVMGAVLLAASLSLLLYNRAEDKRAGESVGSILPLVIEAAEKADEAEDKIEVQESAALPDEACEADDFPEQESESGEMTVTEIDGYGYIGYLSIPVLELELPIMSEWDYTRLKMAPCRYTGSTKTDDLVICAHNYTRHFGTLKNLKAGDLVSFTDMDGVTLTYEVAEIETLQPAEISKLTESCYELTLVTCTLGGKTRVTVRCQRLDDVIPVKPHESVGDTVY